jgi:hypothetical protein
MRPAAWRLETPLPQGARGREREERGHERTNAPHRAPQTPQHGTSTPATTEKGGWSRVPGGTAPHCPFGCVRPTHCFGRKHHTDGRCFVIPCSAMPTTRRPPWAPCFVHGDVRGRPRVLSVHAQRWVRTPPWPPLKEASAGETVSTFQQSQQVDTEYGTAYPRGHPTPPTLPARKGREAGKRRDPTETAPQLSRVAPAG